MRDNLLNSKLQITYHTVDQNESIEFNDTSKDIINYRG